MTDFRVAWLKSKVCTALSVPPDMFDELAERFAKPLRWRGH